MASIDRLPGGSWRVRWRLNGAAQTLSFEDETLAKNAKDIAEAHRHKVDKVFVFRVVNGLPEPSTEETIVASGPTVAELVPDYLKSLLDVDPRTKRDNRRLLERGAFPVIGDMPVAAVTSVEITEIIDRIKKTGVTRRTIRNYFNVMKGFFSYAVKVGKCTTNPVKDVDWKPPSLAKYNVGQKEDEHFYMTREQYQLLRSKFNDADQILLDFIVQTGARWSEATAIKVQALKLRPGSHPLVDICEAWKEGEDGTWYVGPPKAGSNRVIPVRKSLITRLQPLLGGKRKDALIFTGPAAEGRLPHYIFRWRWEAAVTAAMRCDLHPPATAGQPTKKADLLGPRCGDNGGWKETGVKCRQWVTPGWNRCHRHRGIPLDAYSDCECWDRRLPKRPTVHDLRHTHAAWLIAAGTISLKAISMRLGHSTTEVTEKVYAGLLREIDDRIVEATAIGDEDELLTAA